MCGMPKFLSFPKKQKQIKKKKVQIQDNGYFWKKDQDHTHRVLNLHGQYIDLLTLH